MSQKQKGMLGGPFQLMISVVVLGIAMSLGFYLYDQVTCWKCNEQLDAELVELRERIASVGQGDINSREAMNVEVDTLGGCAKSIHLQKLTNPSGMGRCKAFCPNHPNDCWVIFADRSCGSKGYADFECIDISSDMKLESEILGEITSEDTENVLMQGSLYIGSSRGISIKKTGVDVITIDNI